jgi:uncharacterized C2H2 Zn-finger protein
MAEMCSECGSEFGSAADLVLHMKEAHKAGTVQAPAPEPEESPQQDLACPFCGEVFHNGEDLAVHNREMHPPEEGTSVTG